MPQPHRRDFLGNCLLALGASTANTLIADPQPHDVENFPQYLVPGFEREMKLLQEMHRLHHSQAFTTCTLWDAWLPLANLWPGTDADGTAKRNRDHYRASVLRRRIDSEGYVSMQQHRGMAHSEGWPFPAYQQSTGVGWHFSVKNESWAIQHFGLKALTDTKGWEINGAAVEAITAEEGLKLRATGPTITLTTPAFACGTIVAPFIRLEWAAQGLSDTAKPSLCWQLQGESSWKPERGKPFATFSEHDGVQYTNVPLYGQPGYAGILTRLRLTFPVRAGAKITLKSLITAIDTRHPITNLNFIRGATEYFHWTTDVDYLRDNIQRMRRALHFVLNEFQVREYQHVVVNWVGHDGRSGLLLSPGKAKQRRIGLGVGNNYWDLLPFGGHDALATIYLYDTLCRMAALEQAITQHPAWKLPKAETEQGCQALTTLADTVRRNASSYFWNKETGRFVGWIDLAGQRYDYGFTFVNMEAIYYGLATDEQARSIFAWINGERIIAGDTSTGADIYHWRFGARSTTRRNIETYVWVWHDPESIPWGGQVQDGGAVLGFSYFDLMARLRTRGPDDAWQRLREILDWFNDVTQEGGYRKYYAKPGRGTLQGGGPPGGLGMDQEFLESVLLPQVMLYGFLGCSPRPGGLEVLPRLPRDWPSLTVTKVHVQGAVVDITANREEIILVCRKSDGGPFRLWLPAREGKQAHLSLQLQTGKEYRFKLSKVSPK